jgi:hypothetical protein
MSGRRQRPDNGLAARDHFDVQLRTFEEAHPEEWLAFCGIDRDAPRAAIPEDDRFVHVESHRAAVTQHGTAVAPEGKVKLGDEMRRQR